MCASVKGRQFLQLVCDILLYFYIIRCFYFCFGFVLLHDLVLLWIQVLLILCCDEVRSISQRMSHNPV